MNVHDLLAGASIRINALQGTDPVELQITYSQRPLTDEVFQSSILPMNAIRDSLVWATGKLAETIALSDNRVLRAYLRSETDPLVSGADLPSVDLAGAPIIGNFGAVLDGTDQTKILTRMPVAVVRNRLLSTGIFLAPAYYFALASGQILHTRTTAILECCVWDADAQTEVYDHNGTFTLADSLAEAVICGGCAMLVRDDEFVEQSGRWATYFGTTLASIPPAKMEGQAA